MICISTLQGRVRTAIAPALLLMGLGTGNASVDSVADEVAFVRLGTAELTLKDVDASLQELAANHRANLFADPERIGKHLERMVLRRALSQEAMASELMQDLDISTLEDDIRRQLLILRQTARFRSSLPAPPESDVGRLALELYEQNQDSYKIREAVTVSHVLIGTDERTDSAARAVATEVLEKARDGVPFTELVKQYSDDPSKGGNQGVYEKFVRGKMVPPFEEASFAMTEPGQLAGPVRTRFGYHIIRFHERFEETHQPYEQVSASLMEQARSQLTEELYRQRLAEFEDPQVEMLARANQAGLDKEPLFAEEMAIKVEQAIVKTYKERYLALHRPASFENLARERYLTRKRDYRTPTTVSITHIFIDGQDRDPAEARQLAESVLKLALDGADFTDLVMTHSEDNGKTVNGGRIVIREGEQPGPLGDAVMAMTEIGGIVGPVSTERGLYIVRLDQRQESYQPTFDEVKAQIVAGLAKKYDTQIWESRLDETRRLPFWADEETVYSLRTRYISRHN